MSDLLDYNLLQVAGVKITVFTVISSSAIVFFTWLVLKVLSAISAAYFRRKGIEEGRQYAFLQLVKYFVWTLAILWVLDNMGVKITILLAGSAALLVGLGLGLQQIFQDLVSGIFILFEGTIRVNDVIEIEGLIGKILNINLRTSRVLTRDGIIIIVPNHRFVVDKIINWSHNTVATRFKVRVGVAYGSDVEKVRKILMECALQHADCITDPGLKQYHPFARFVDFGESSLEFELYFWSNNIFYIENTKSDLRFMINQRFREEGIVIPFPQRDVHIKR
ncbi:MAG: mechanosensitive ion channel protein MscS [Cyclobacteriaceae bacterium]|nr:MAG: mechanosensitive ion channel protein MscS [Cyclobacteriaceae bacterium]